jgi:hypothetical protein
VTENLEAFCEKHGFLKAYYTSAKNDVGINEAAKYLVDQILQSGSETEARFANVPNVNLNLPTPSQSKPSCCG